MKTTKTELLSLSGFYVAAEKALRILTERATKSHYVGHL